MSTVKHLALVKFKPGTGDPRITECFEAIGRLRQTISGILDYSWGPNNSPENLNQGFTHGFVMTFTDAAARDAYLPHPAHEQVKQLVLPHVESVLVFDYEVR
jgi:hypothetical protein